MWVRGLKLQAITYYMLVMNVAPHVGAWIETALPYLDKILTASHPMWVRGLKLCLYRSWHPHPRSHPMWVRGLKPRYRANTHDDCGSHPMWVRGLKLSRLMQWQLPSVAPHVGAWIETITGFEDAVKLIKVAPHVGAWIETLTPSPPRLPLESHPMWVRGLKLKRIMHPAVVSRRTPYGCVD